jgi:hypothetical protein
MDPRFGADPIANAIGTYVLSRDRVLDRPNDPNVIYYSLTPSGQSFYYDSVGGFGSTSPYRNWYYVPYMGVYASVKVTCISQFVNGAYTPGTMASDFTFQGKFLPNDVGSFVTAVYFSQLNNNFSGFVPAAASPCGVSAQTTGRISVYSSVNSYSSSGNIVNGFSSSSFDNATVTLQKNG